MAYGMDTFTDSNMEYFDEFGGYGPGSPGSELAGPDADEGGWEGWYPDDDVYRSILSAPVPSPVVQPVHEPVYEKEVKSLTAQLENFWDNKVKPHIPDALHPGSDISTFVHASPLPPGIGHAFFAGVQKLSEISRNHRAQREGYRDFSDLSAQASINGKDSPAGRIYAELTNPDYPTGEGGDDGGEFEQIIKQYNQAAASSVGSGGSFNFNDLNPGFLSTGDTFGSASAATLESLGLRANPNPNEPFLNISNDSRSQFGPNTTFGEAQAAGLDFSNVVGPTGEATTLSGSGGGNVGTFNIPNLDFDIPDSVDPSTEDGQRVIQTLLMMKQLQGVSEAEFLTKEMLPYQLQQMGFEAQYSNGQLSGISPIEGGYFERSQELRDLTIDELEQVLSGGKGSQFLQDRIAERKAELDEAGRRNFGSLGDFQTSSAGIETEARFAEGAMAAIGEERRTNMGTLSAILGGREGAVGTQSAAQIGAAQLPAASAQTYGIPAQAGLSNIIAPLQNRSMINEQAAAARAMAAAGQQEPPWYEGLFQGGGTGFGMYGAKKFADLLFE